MPYPEFGTGGSVGKDITPKKVSIYMGNEPPREGYQLTEPSRGIVMPCGGNVVGEGFVVVNEREPSGFWSMCMIHISRILGG